MTEKRKVLYGVHTTAALENFPLSGRSFNKLLGRAYGKVKLACAQTNYELKYIPPDKYTAIEKACQDLISGNLDEHLVVDALQGGAGTATNFNINEVLANRALQLLKKDIFEYQYIDPQADINLHQSTNDTYPTALKVAALDGLALLEKELIILLESFQQKEKLYAHIVKTGRTQLRDAVLTTMGRTMSAYAEAISRDRWRIYKSMERIRIINLGGTAIGTGLGAPKKYIFMVTERLKAITGLPLSRAENMIDCTQNCDVFAEVSGLLKTCSVNLYKICQDFRLMASGPDAGLNELVLKRRQMGSTIMAGKINPVIPEAVIQCAMQIDGNDYIITRACADGNLELNAFMPVIADKLLDSIMLLSQAVKVMSRFVSEDISINEKACELHVHNSTAAANSFVKELGYSAVQNILIQVESGKISLRDAILSAGVSADRYNELISAEAVTRLGD